MARKKRKGRMSAFRKMARKVGSGLGSVVIIAGLAHGAIAAGTNLVQTGDVGRFPQDLVYQYSGYNPTDGSFSQQRAISSGTTILASIIVGKAIKWGSKYI